MTPSNPYKKSEGRQQTLYLLLVFLCAYAGMMNFYAGHHHGPSVSSSSTHASIVPKKTRSQSEDSSKQVGTRTRLGLARNPSDPQPERKPVELQGMRLHNRLMVIPEYKLLFCYIEKVGCSMFNQLFRLLRIYHPSVSPEEREWLAQSHFGRANPTHFNMTLRDVKHLVNDDKWTKAVFFRDPADRFLSGFKSKCGGADADGGRHCRLAFGDTPNPKGGKPRPILDGSPTSFHHSIDIAMNNTKKVFSNPHFKASAHFCGGLGKSIDHYSFVHMLDKNTVATHLKSLLDHLDVDEVLAEDLLERIVKTGGKLDPIDIDRVKEKYGLKLKGGISPNHHTEEHHVTAKDYFQLPEILKKLQSVYQMDYDMFQLEPPHFEDLH